MIDPAENLWEDVMAVVEEGHVVPIVGRDLLLVDTAEGLRPFHQIVAERLASELNIPHQDLLPGFDLNDVVCAYKGFHGDPTGINVKVVRLLRNLEVRIPEPLRLLVQIPSFRLFVATTVDTLLERTISAVRGREPTVIPFPPSSVVTDFEEKLLDGEGTVVYHLLGRVSASSSFAVTEGQVLENMHEFMTGTSRPERLVARLRESHLLLLGVSFPDWLARFLLRLARSKPLWDSRPMLEVIADGDLSGGGLGFFLKHFSPHQSRMFNGGSPVDFVRELNRRWFERHPQTATLGPSGPSQLEPPADMVRGSVFISYAREDRNAAFRLAEELTAAGLEVWIDRRLNPGDDFRRTIDRNIRECCAFVAVLSQHTQPEDARYFRSEWATATECAQPYFGTSRTFLFPVVVDATPVAELAEVRRRTFGATSTSVALNAACSPQLIQQLDRAQKDWRRQFAQA